MNSSLEVTTIDGNTKVREIIKDQYLAADLDETIQLQKFAEKNKFQAEIVWRNVVLFSALHIGALIGLYQFLFLAKWQTMLFTLFLYAVGSMGITIGAHRLWSHKSFKAKMPFQFVLMLADTVAFQNDVIEWARDHRCHHKWTDTDADPHNTNRGFFFSHMGWLLMRKHPKITEMGKKLDLSDLYANPILMFQKRNFLPLAFLITVLIPTAIPVYFWGEKAYYAFYCAVLFRYCLTLHVTWFINSVAHMFGYRPYDRKLTAVESVWTSITAFGEGGHNYHHTFPQDYRASEMSYLFNWSRYVIDTVAQFGWVYDLKVVDEASIVRQCEKQGDIKKRV
ncbi:unnamed protein product [Bursaphelenchus okinawaensis]|uniref:Fatty acid desaturase domain-containing protein n=1 Tax=Bursaphelenchus okinawaensis TaxID=465554 RepID=A0A811KTZ1_9BILA|nr:unnamed protein product [Bursaphelenchus okinawaensis]CAG9113194.1 unnamed protein product [Bursaphelenchus okinawaensis]